MRFCLAALMACGIAAPSPAGAQTRTPPSIQAPAPDFLFGRPDGSVAVRGSWMFARAGSDWYDFVTRHLTLERGDFNAPAINVEYGIAVGPRAEAVVGIDYGQSATDSEYRDLVDNNRLPITQTTRLREFNVSGNLKWALTPRGHEVSRLAWVPNRVVPYAGAGGGLLRYQMTQVGDFVDFVDRSIFTDALTSEGWTPSAQVFGGVDVQVYRRFYLTLDGRYLWAAGDLGRDWIDFEKIDLAGGRISAGINFIF